MRQVFLSSTARDLQEYRDAVFQAIQKCDGWHIVRMEDFGARARVIGTGEMVQLIAAETKAINVVDDCLTLKGLKMIYEMNA